MPQGACYGGIETHSVRNPPEQKHSDAHSVEMVVSGWCCLSSRVCCTCKWGGRKQAVGACAFSAAPDVSPTPPNPGSLHQSGRRTRLREQLCQHFFCRHQR